MLSAERPLELSPPAFLFGKKSVRTVKHKVEQRGDVSGVLALKRCGLPSAEIHPTVVIGTTASVFEFVEGLHYQRAIVKMSRNDGFLKAEIITGGKGDGFRRDDALGVCGALNDTPVAGRRRAGAESLNSQ